ncbi:MAG: cytochrome c3 family protein [Betaproteobacteria bacterium]
MRSQSFGPVCMVASLILCLTSGAWAASIVGSFHDLAHIDDVHTGPGGWGRTYDDYNEVCVYCHTPHHANQAQGALWNRPAQVTTYTVYSSPTLDSTPGQPGRSSKLCLSCHDGTIAVDAVINAPQYHTESAGVHGTMIYPRKQSLIDCGSCHQPEFATWFGDFSLTYFNNSLQAGHPVGITYGNDPKLVPLPPDGKFPNGVRVLEGKVECLSCHNPHDPANRPFLVTSDEGSALCYTCHLK